MIHNSPKAKMVERLWDIIYADKISGGKPKEGWGLTNHSIKQEDMTSGEIAQVLKKKPHHVIRLLLLMKLLHYYRWLIILSMNSAL